MRALATAALFCCCPAALRGQESGEPPYVPTPMAIVGAMLDLAAVRSGDVLYDLGSGDGRIVVTAATRFGSRGVGYEHQLPLVEASRELAARAGVSHLVRFAAEDLFRADLSEATVVTLYLGDAFNRRLRPLLLEQLRPGSRVVSNTFHMGEWGPDSTVHLDSGAARTTLHLWVVPASVDGFWSLQVEGDPAGFVLEFRQRFQRGDGRAVRGERSLPLRDLLLRGEQIRFRLGVGREAMTFSGQLVEGRLMGTVVSSTGVKRWRALRFNDPALAPG